MKLIISILYIVILSVMTFIAFLISYSSTFSLTKSGLITTLGILLCFMIGYEFKDKDMFRDY